MPDEPIQSPDANGTPTPTPASVPPPVEPGVPGPKVADSVPLEKYSRRDIEAYQFEKDLKAERESRTALEARMEALKQDPLGVLAEMGIQPDFIKERMEHEGQRGPNETMVQYEKRLAEMEAKLQAKEEAEQERERKSEMKTYSAQVREAFDQEDEDLTGFFEMQEAIGLGESAFVSTVEETKKSYEDMTGKQLTTAEAAGIISRKVKEYVEAQRSNQSVRAAIAKVYGLQVPDDTEAPAPVAKPAPPTGETLTAKDGKGQPPLDPSQFEQGSPEEMELLKRAHIPGYKPRAVGKLGLP